MLKSKLGDLTVFHANKLIRAAHHALVVCRKNKCGFVFLVDLLHQLEDALAGPAVEVRSRLVSKHDAGMGHQGTRDCHPLTLPTRKLIRAVTCIPAQTNHLQIMINPTPPLFFAELRHLQQRILDILLCRQHRQKVEGLKNKADCSCPNIGKFVGRLP